MAHGVQRGFSLLEAIVALVLIAGVGMALFGWINANLLGLARVADVSARAEATQNALEYMHSVNPMATPTGEARLGSYALRWAAEPVSVLVDRTSSLYQLRLYRTRVQVLLAAGDPWFDFSIEQVGYKRVRTREKS